MEYDPIKMQLARLLGGSGLLRRCFFAALDLWFLRAWYVARELRRLRKSGFPHSPNFQSSIFNLQFLDAGMGFGQYSHRLLKIFPTARVVGLELDRAHLYGSEQFFRKYHPTSRIIIGDVRRLPVMAGQFHLILTVDVMEHVDDDAAAFAGYFRALKDGGWLVMHTPRDKREEPPLTPPLLRRGGSSDADPLLRKGGSSDADPLLRRGGNLDVATTLRRGVSDSTAGWTVDEHVRDGYHETVATARLQAAGFKVRRVVRGYGAAGMVAWTLLQRIPIGVLGRSRAFAPLVLLYLITVSPVALVAMWLDYIKGDHPEGGSLLVVAQKPI